MEWKNKHKTNVNHYMTKFRNHRCDSLQIFQYQPPNESHQTWPKTVILGCGFNVSIFGKREGDAAGSFPKSRDETFHTYPPVHFTFAVLEMSSQHQKGLQMVLHFLWWWILICALKLPLDKRERDLHWCCKPPLTPVFKNTGVKMMFKT